MLQRYLVVAVLSIQEFAVAAVDIVEAYWAEVRGVLEKPANSHRPMLLLPVVSLLQINSLWRLKIL